MRMEEIALEDGVLMSGSDDLRGSAPMLTAKDVLLEVRADVKAMSRNVDVLVSQQLDSRLNQLETWRDRVDGRVSVIQIGLASLGAAVAVLVGLATLATFFGWTV
jgi:hypothetical protein